MTTLITEIHFPQAGGPYPLGCIVSRAGGSTSVASLAGNGMAWHAPRQKHGEVRCIALPDPASESRTNKSVVPAARWDEWRQAPASSIQEGAHA
jgi:hypothetical protein